MNVLSVKVENGKYEVVMDESGRLVALRYGESWRDCSGDKLIYALAAEIENLREKISTLKDDAERRGLRK